MAVSILLIVAVFITGAALGVGVTYLRIYKNTAEGFFDLLPSDPDNPEIYSLHIQLREGLYLLDKDKIILYNRESTI